MKNFLFMFLLYKKSLLIRFKFPENHIYKQRIARDKVLIGGKGDYKFNHILLLVTLPKELLSPFYIKLLLPIKIFSIAENIYFPFNNPSCCLYNAYSIPIKYSPWSPKTRTHHSRSIPYYFISVYLIKYNKFYINKYINKSN